MLICLGGVPGVDLQWHFLCKLVLTVDVVKNIMQRHLCIPNHHCDLM